MRVEAARQTAYAARRKHAPSIGRYQLNMHEAQAQTTHAQTDPSATLLGRFQHFARLSPERTAIACGPEHVSYGELDERSTRVAQALRARGVESESIVGICLPRKPSFVVAMLGVLKAGAAYLPLDPTYPEDRRDYMVSDAGAKVVIDSADFGQDVGASATWPEPDPHDLAYVMYTSGST